MQFMLKKFLQKVYSITNLSNFVSPTVTLILDTGGGSPLPLGHTFFILACLPHLPSNYFIFFKKISLKYHIANLSLCLRKSSWKGPQLIPGN